MRRAYTYLEKLGKGGLAGRLLDRFFRALPVVDEGRVRVDDLLLCEL